MKVLTPAFLASLPVRTVLLSKLYTPDWKLATVVNDLAEGRPSFSTGVPIRVSHLDSPRGGLYVIDGNHRALEALRRGETRIQAVVDPNIPRIERTGGAYRREVESKVRIAEASRP